MNKEYGTKLLLHLHLLLLPFLILQWPDSAGRAPASSVARLQISRPCTNLLHPHIFSTFTIWSICLLSERNALLSYGHDLAVMQKTQIVCAGIRRPPVLLIAFGVERSASK